MTSLRLPLIAHTNSPLHSAFFAGEQESNRRSNSLEHGNFHVARVDDCEDSHVAWCGVSSLGDPAFDFGVGGWVDADAFVVFVAFVAGERGRVWGP